MPANSASLASLHRRLTPLYIAAFFQGFVIWYSTEKLFMRSIGFDDAAIGLMVAIYSGVMLATETPFGILADRWSRKGVLMLASASLATSALLGGLSYNVGFFLVAMCFWGIFFAMYSGTYDSIVYDVLAEDGHSSSLFDRVYGRIRIIDSVALVAGSVIGGVVAQFFSTRITYFLTIPSALIAIGALVFFREPTLHRANAAAPILQHIKNTLSAVTRNRNLAVVLTILVLAAVIEYISFEFDQLWLIALATPAVIFGPANALLLATYGVGGWVVKHARARRSVLALLLVSAVIGAVGLVFGRSYWLIIVAQTLVASGVVSLQIYYTRNLHDSLTAGVRTGAASAVSTLGRCIIIPMALIFGALSQGTNVFTAGWLILGGIVMLSGLVLYQSRSPQITP